MFITPTSNNTFNEYDPLVTGYLTQNQMGYLPNPGFMTPASYGAFRTVPPANYITNQSMNPSLFQSFLIANNGMGIINTFNPAANNIRREIYAQRQLADATSAIGAGLGSTALSLGAGALIAGPLGIAAGLGVGAVADVAMSGYLDRIRSMREIQRATMSRITFGDDVSTGLGQGFSATAARRIDKSIRAQSSKDAFFDKEDYDLMFKAGLDSGMFDMSNTADQYIRTFKKLRGNLRVMMGLFESADFQELGAQMQRMQAMGVSIQDMSGISFTEKNAARMLGLSHADAVSMYGQQGALISNSLGLSGILGSSLNLSVAGRLEAARRTGLLTAGQWSALGGVSGAAQTITTKQLGTISSDQMLLPLMGYLAKDGDVGTIDPTKLNNLVSGNVNMSDFNKSISNINNLLSTYGPDKGLNKINQAKGVFLDNLVKQSKTDEVLMGVLVGMYNMYGKPTGISLPAFLRNFGFADREIEALLASYDKGAILAKKSNMNASLTILGKNYSKESDANLWRNIKTGVSSFTNDIMDDLYGGGIASRNMREDIKERVESGAAYNVNLSPIADTLFQEDLSANYYTATQAINTANNSSEDFISGGSTYSRGYWGKKLRTMNTLTTGKEVNTDEVVELIFNMLDPVLRDAIPGRSMAAKKANLKKTIIKEIGADVIKKYADRLNNSDILHVLIERIRKEYSPFFGSGKFRDAEYRSYWNLNKLTPEQQYKMIRGLGTMTSQSSLDDARTLITKNYNEQLHKQYGKIRHVYNEYVRGFDDDAAYLFETFGGEALSPKDAESLSAIQESIRRGGYNNFNNLPQSVKDAISALPGGENIDQKAFMSAIQKANLKGIKDAVFYKSRVIDESLPYYHIGAHIGNLYDPNVVKEWGGLDKLDKDAIKNWYEKNKDNKMFEQEVRFAKAYINKDINALTDLVSTGSTYQHLLNNTREGRDALQTAEATRDMMSNIGDLLGDMHHTDNKLVDTLNATNDILAKLNNTLLRTTKN